MEQVVEVQVESEKIVEEQAITEISAEWLGKIGGGTGAILL